MRTSTPSASLVSSLVAAALALAPIHGAMAAPAEKSEPAAEAPAPDAAEAPTAEAEPTEPPAELTPEEAAAARDAEIEANVTKAQTELDEAKGKVEAAAEAEDVEAALAEAEADVVEARTALDDAKAALAESRSDLDADKAALEESRAALETMPTKGRAAAKAKAEAEAAIADTETNLAEREATITAAEASVTAVEAAITELEAAIAEARAEAEAKAAAAAAEAEAKAKAEAEATPSFLEDDRPPEPRIANKPAKGKGLMIAGGTVAGVGLGTTIAFTLITRNCSYDGPLQCRLQNQDNFLIPMGAAALLTGVMLLGVGVGYHVRYKRWEKWSPEEKKTAVVPTATRNSAGLAVVGRF